eukprot:6723839-Prymnesium_polylepis.1
MKDGRAIVWGYLRHEGRGCTVGDRVWWPRFASAGLRRSRVVPAETVKPLFGRCAGRAHNGPRSSSWVFSACLRGVLIGNRVDYARLRPFKITTPPLNAPFTL